MLPLDQATDQAHQGQRFVDAEDFSMLPGWSPLDIHIWLRQHQPEKGPGELTPTDSDGWASWKAEVTKHRRP